MLTLGLMEGIFAATAMGLVLFALADNNVPVHRLLGPPVMALLGFVAFFAWREGAVNSAAEGLGLLTWATLGFFLPLAVLRTLWKQGKALKAGTIAPRMVEEQRAAPAVARPATAAAAPAAPSAPAREIDVREREIDIREEAAPAQGGVVTGRIERAREREEESAAT